MRTSPTTLSINVETVTDEILDNNNDHIQNYLNATDYTQQQYQRHEYIGNKITDEKPEGATRILGGNPNGLNLGLRGGDFNEYMEEVKRMSVDVACLYEINLDTHQTNVKTKLHNNARQIFDHAKLTFTSSTIPSVNEFKPGGTLIITQGNITGRVVESGADDLGRWTYQKLACKDNRYLTIISAYQVCEQSINNSNRVRSLTATAQQTSILRQQGRSESPRQAFIKDLDKFIKVSNSPQDGILLIGDFNEALGISVTGMTKLLSDNNLLDVMLHEIRDDNFATFIDGRERVDYAACTDWVSLALLRACYEPFCYRTKGDHRNILLDFDTNTLFGNPTYSLPSYAQRDFNSKDKTSVRQYIEHKYEYLMTHNFESRIQQLTNNWDEAEAEKLDADFQRSSFHAGKQCKKKPNITFTREIAALRKQKNVLLRVIKQSSSGINLSDSIALLTQEGNDFLIPPTIEECKLNLKQTNKSIHQKEKDAVTHRRNELNTLKEKLLSDGDKKGAKQVRQQIVAENTKNMYKKLRAFSGVNKAGLSRLQVPKDPDERDYKNCIEWITIDTPDEIEENLRTNKQRHFGQAHGTFPTVPPFSEWVDWSASTHISDLILEGDFTSEQLTSLEQQLINHMKKRTTLDSIPAKITKEEWEGKIKSWPETTSTSPSGFHLGHSKVLIAPHDIPKDTPQGQSLESKRSKLIEWQLALLNIAIDHGYSYERWQTIVNVLILKEPSNFKIHRLRVIHIYEHDFNLILANKWRQLIQIATKEKRLNAGQFGGIPGRDAIMPTVIEELQYEISRASKRPLVHNDYDALSCYDRIILALASILSRAQGMHKNICLVHAKTLKQAKYLLKTKMKVSEAFFQHCTIFPIYGSGQGSANSPALWCIISSVLFDIYEENAHGASFYSPDMSVTTKVFLIGFVDDKSGSTNDFLLAQPAPPSHYISLATHDSQCWNDLLKLSGGALEDSKCSYHVLHYDFTVNGLPILKSNVVPPLEIRFNDATDPSPLKYKTPYTAHKILGTQKEPAGTQKAAWQAISAKNEKHAKLVARNPLNRTDAWSYYHAIYLPSISFPFPSGYLTKAQCTKLQVQMKQAILPKYGFNRNTPNAVVYGHSDYAGIEFRTIYVEQGLAQVQAFLVCLRTDGVPNKLALIAISWAQFLSGISKPILQDVSTPLPHLDPMKLIPAIRAFLQSVNSSIEVEKDFIPQLQRENDTFLMDTATAHEFSNKNLQLINACRLYLGVTFMSDIVSSDGNCIYQNIWDGVASVTDKPKGLLAYQTNPGKAAWSDWRKLLRLYTKNRNTQLTQPLGRWFITGETTYRQWKFYFHESQDTIYILKNDEYEVYNRLGHEAIQYTGHTTASLPSSSVPIDIDFTSTQINPLPYHSLYPAVPTSTPTSFPAFIDTLDEWERDMLQNTVFQTNVYDFCHQISTNDATHFTSDGSAPNFIGTFGWVCSLTNGTRIASNSGPAYGHRTSSFRAEGYGSLSYLRLIIRASEYTGYELNFLIQCHTDSESLLKQVKKFLEFPFYYPNLTMSADWDVLQSICTSLQSFDQLPTLNHVKGHQDRTRNIHTLPLPAQLNVEADALAGDFIYPANSDPSLVPRISGNNAQFHSPKGTLTSRFKQNIRKQSSEPEMIQRLRYQYEWSQFTFDSIDWEIHGICVRKHYNKKHFTTKFVHDWLPTNSRTSKYDHKYSPKCASCPCEYEDLEHLLRCPAREQWQRDLLQDLRIKSEAKSTRPELLEILLEGISSWLEDRPLCFNNYPYNLSLLISKQSAVGWHQLLLGRFVKEWRELQDDHLQTIKGQAKHNNGGTWVSSTVTIIWSHVHINWKARNDIQHGIDLTAREIALLEIAKRETSALYEIQEDVLPRDRELYYDSLDHHYEREPTSRGLRQWINTWKPVLLRSAKEAITLGATRLHNIRNFFTPTNTS